MALGENADRGSEPVTPAVKSETPATPQTDALTQIGALLRLAVTKTKSVLAQDECMQQPIDVLVADYADRDARKTLAAIRRVAPIASTLRVLHGDQAARLMFNRGLFTAEPQIPRLVILDLNLPRIDGKSLLRRLSRHARTQRVPVVVFTESRNAEDIHDSYRLGARAYIEKPADPLRYDLAVEQVAAKWLNNAA
jgi:DNA-binding NarL/FixJ family response regulator